MLDVCQILSCIEKGSVELMGCSLLYAPIASERPWKSVWFKGSYTTALSSLNSGDLDLKWRERSAVFVVDMYNKGKDIVLNSTLVGALALGR